LTPLADSGTTFTNPLTKGVLKQAKVRQFRALSTLESIS